MKSIRKLASLLLALVMVFALAVTAFADEPGTTTTPVTGSITVDNPQNGTTYTAYKIFDVTYNGDNYSYTIKGDSKWYDTVHTYATPEHGLTLTPVADTTANTFVVTFVDDTNATNKFSAPDFAAALKNALDGGSVTDTGRQLSADGTSVTVKDLKLGYYFVKSDATDALCNLTTTNPNANIHDKNDMPFKKTVNNADVANVDVGKTVTFTITGKVPDYTGFDTYTYKIADKMSDGLTFDQSSVSVKVDGTQVETGKYTLTVGSNTDTYTFELSINNVKDFQIGKDIEVTYNATVNKKAIAVLSENKAKLIYSNDPTSDGTGVIKPPVVKVYTSKIVINKYETDNENKKLNGAKFVLYKEVPTEGATEATKMYYKWDETAQEVEWNANKDQATVKETGKDGNNGEASFDGLADGTYYLVETKAPAGYNQLDKPVKVEVHVGENAGAVTSDTQLTVTENVANKAGTLLPSTGGMGTTIFYVLGFVLVVGAGVLLVTKKRMSQGEV